MITGSDPGPAYLPQRRSVGGSRRIFREGSRGACTFRHSLRRMRLSYSFLSQPLTTIQLRRV